MTKNKYSATKTRTMPLTRRKIASLSRKILVELGAIITKATAMYQIASIKAAVIPIKAVSSLFGSERIIWLNIARKNTSIFGLRRDIRKPSPTPRSKVFE
jgi:hypothetical protein